MKRGIAMEYQKKAIYILFNYFISKMSKKIEIKAHYHEFDKIILFLSGKVKYNIEGQTYQLFPYDMFLYLIIVFIILLLAIQQHMNVLSFILTLII